MTDTPVFRNQATVRAENDETLRNLGYTESAAPPPHGVKPTPRRISAPNDPEEGEYIIKELIGHGGMGEVYAARHSPTDRLVALKVALRDDKDYANRLLWEAQATAKLEHPGIVPVHDIGFADTTEMETPIMARGQPFYAMRMFSGGKTWDSIMSSLSLRDNIDILLRVADAIRYAHSQNILHRDLKPANVMMGDFGEVFVMDWGLAVALGETAMTGVSAKPLVDGCANSLGLSLGTPAYTAPELAKGDVAQIGPATDIYLLGAILFEILAGAPPHGRGDNPTLLRAAISNAIEWERIPPKRRDLSAIVARAMKDAPDERYKGVGEFQAALKDWQRHSEAMELVAKAEDELARARAHKNDPSPDAAYDAFVNARGLLDAALELTSNHAEIHELRLELDNDHASAALDWGDLDLALSRLPTEGGNERTEVLRTRVTEARLHRRLRNRRYRYFRGFLIVATGVALILLLFAAYQANQANKAQWDLSNRLFINGATSRSIGHDYEAESNFLEALQLFKRLGRNDVAPALALRDVKNRNLPSKRFPSVIEQATGGDSPVLAWTFPRDGDTAVCLAVSSAVGINARNGEIVWKWTAPDAVKGTWTASPSGLTALFVPSRSNDKPTLLDLTSGLATNTGNVDGTPFLISPRFAVADDGLRWYMAGRTETGEWTSRIYEKTDGVWNAESLHFAQDLDCAQFLDSNTLFLSSPKKNNLGGRHLLIRKQKNGWRLSSAFGKRLGNPVQSVLFFKKKNKLVVSYARPPAILKTSEREDEAFEWREMYFPSGTTEEWAIDGDTSFRLSGRGRRYPDVELAGLGRWLDVSFGNHGWPKLILFNANAADGLTVLLRLPGEGVAPEVMRLLISENYRFENRYAYVVAGNIAPERNELRLGMSDGTMLIYSIAVEFERNLKLPIEVTGERPLTGVAASGDGTRLLFASSGGKCAIVDTESWNVAHTLSIDADNSDENIMDEQVARFSLLEFILVDGRITPQLPVALNNDGRKAAFFYKNKIVLWDQDGIVQMKTISSCPETPLALQFDNAGTLNAYTTDSWYVFSKDGWELRKKLTQTEEWLTILHPFAVSKDGTRLLRMVVKPSVDSLLGIRQGTAERQACLEAWDVPNGKRLWSANVIATAFAWSSDNKLIGASLSGGTECVLLDGNTGKIITILNQLAPTAIARLAFSSDSRFLAATSVTHQLRIWSIEDRLECIRRPFMQDHSSSYGLRQRTNDPLLFLPDCRLVVFDTTNGMQYNLHPAQTTNEPNTKNSPSMFLLMLDHLEMAVEKCYGRRGG